MSIKARDIAREEEAEGRPVGSKGGSVFCHRRLHLGPSLSLSLSLPLLYATSEGSLEGGRKADYHKRKSGARER